MSFRRLLFFSLAFSVLMVGCSGDDTPSSPQILSGGIGDDESDGGNDESGGNDDESGGDDDSTANDSSGTKGTWDLPKSEIVAGCFGLDCIPSIDNPKFVTVPEVNFVDETDLVWGLVLNGNVWGFPENIMDWHETVNFNDANISVAITYCPFTGSALAVNLRATTIDDFFENRASLGISGLLYNNNLINYDRATGSNWSQMYMRSVNGRLRGMPTVKVPLIETTWSKWKEMFPNSLVLSDDTGFNRNYDIWPYGNFKEVEDLLFPLTIEDHRLFFKERVHGIVTDRFAPSAKVYRFIDFENPRTINDEVDGRSVVVAGMSSADVYVSYSRVAQDGTVLTFSIKTDNPTIFPFDLVDTEGTVWNLLGHAVSGPREGEQLRPTDSYNAYWFAWGAFFPGVPIYQ